MLDDLVEKQSAHSLAKKDREHYFDGGSNFLRLTPHRYSRSEKGKSRKTIGPAYRSLTIFTKEFRQFTRRCMKCQYSWGKR